MSMRTLRNSLPALFVILAISGCSKDELPAPAPTVIKYEIITTAPLTTSPVAGRIVYTSGNGADSTDVTFIAGETSWEKTITVTSSTRPITFRLSTPDGFVANQAGLIKGRIYVNNGIVAFAEQGSVLVGGNVYLSLTPLEYTLP